MKILLIAALVLPAMAALAAEPAPPVPALKFALPPLQLSEALRLAPRLRGAPLKPGALTLSNAGPLPPLPAPVALPAQSDPGKTMILLPRNIDPRMPIKRPDARIDPRMVAPVSPDGSGK